MTNKIYRLENFNAVRIIYDSGCIPALAVNLDKNSSHYGWLCSAGSDGKWISICDIRNILVEVTPADFDTKQLADELIRRISCGEYIDLLSKGVPVKEKTLADFSDDELYKELASRDCTSEQLIIYKQGYEAGKRDAAPKWIKINDWIEIGKDESFPKSGEVLVYDSSVNRVGCAHTQFIYWTKNITHWMLLPAAPNEPEKDLVVEKPEPKYVCVQCALSYGQIATQEKGNIFCSAKCAEDYEWIPAAFPRDYNKECRYWNEIDRCWDKSTLIGYGNLNHIGLYFITKIGRHKICQVRRDSVEGK